MNSMVLLAVMAATTGFAPSAVSSTAQVYDPDSRLLAEAHFDAAADSFAVTKLVAGGGRTYLQYRYTGADGTAHSGTQWGAREVGETVRFDHDLVEGRRITFRVCVAGEVAFNACSGSADGENWTVAIA
ncbi:hypothetical protein [Actinoplanes regularis]|uniref:Uncharacterized protein n=1 Tax=Actinoplanes regularis TaxID=52697 RepID=A0A239BVA7_9ACTN|nr:hypothetical protein [Actinoplanes regularis]GIE88284.1 hypothetical protein Are01nite_47640 [Actinoplanes regularis]SNS11361.1 hypothetical protein SAMN06264365_110131 [Actinoplanes regularis]